MIHNQVISCFLAWFNVSRQRITAPFCQSRTNFHSSSIITFLKRQTVLLALHCLCLFQIAHRPMYANHLWHLQNYIHCKLQYFNTHLCRKSLQNTYFATHINAQHSKQKNNVMNNFINFFQAVY